ncbi:hypothetical protein ACFLR8_04150 [Bacteroidota bacterium]
MNKIIIFTLLILFLPLVSYSQFTHLGAKAGFSSKVEKPGIGVYGIYRVNDEIKFTPNALYYLPNKIKTQDGTQTFSWWMINLDGNYIIINEGIVKGYGLMGLNFANVTWEQDEVVLGQPEKQKRSMLKLGLNVGAGIRLNLGDKVMPFGELCYTIGSEADFLINEVSTSQFGIFAGFLIRISEDKDRSATEDY